MVNIEKIIKKIYIGYSKRIHSFFQEEQAKKSELKIKITQIIINSSDPEELKNKIVKEIAIELQAYRCFFIEYDSLTNNFKKVVNSYNAQRDSLSMLGYELEKNIPVFAMKQRYMKSIIIEDTEKFIKENKLEGSNEDYYFKNYNIKASLTVRLEFGENFLGVLVVQFDNKKPFLQDIDLKFLKNITEDISIALYLSTLYVNEKIEKERERLLRSIISMMSENFNLAQITQKIFEILGKIYNAQTVFINIDIENFENFYFYNLSEYKSDNTETHNTTDLIDINIYELSDFDLIKNKVHYISDTHNFIIQNNLENSSIEKHFDKNNIKSLILLPILHENLYFGLLIIQFNKPNPITKDDLDFIRTVTYQLAIAIKQIQNYEKQRKIAEREALLRKITNNILTSENIGKALDLICEEIGKLFDAERVKIRNYNKEEGFFSEVITEYRKNEQIPSFVKKGKYPKEVSAYISNILAKDKKNFIINDVENSTIPEYMKEFCASLSTKSLIESPIFYKDQILAIIIIENTTAPKEWEQEKLDLLIPVCQQIALGINLFNLNEELKMALVNEKILRDIIFETRKFTDHDGIYNYLLNQLVNLFNPNRCLHFHHDVNNNLFVMNEVLNDDKLQPLLNKTILSAEYTRELTPEVSSQVSIIKDVNQEICTPELREYLKNNEIQAYLLYSTVRICPGLEKNEILGYTIICYPEPKIWSSYQIDFFKLIVDAVSIIFLEFKQRQETDEVKRTFIATLTHDLRSPIIAEQKALEAMISKKISCSSEHYDEYLQDIYNTNKSLLKMVNNLLAVYHYESGKPVLNKTETNIKDLVAEL